MTAKLFEHLRVSRQRFVLQLERLQAGQFKVLDVSQEPPVDVSETSIERLKELLADVDQLIRIYGVDQK